MIARLIT